MNTHACHTLLVAVLLLPGSLQAQRGNVSIPDGMGVSVSTGAWICADTVFANNPGYGTLTLADPGCLCAGAVITPVELQSLSASVRGGAVALSWSTATESNSYCFEIQRRVSSGRWQLRGVVRAAGTSSAQRVYGFVDPVDEPRPPSGVLRYRLRCIDVSGSSSYSPELTVRVDAPLPRCALSCYPVPSDDDAVATVTIGADELVEMCLQDVTGRVALTVLPPSALSAGTHVFGIRTSALASGLYLLVLNAGSTVRTSKVIVRH